MRVLMLSDFYAPFLGGVETLVRNLAHALCARGHKVGVVTIRHGDLPAFEQDGPVAVHRVRLATERVSGFLSQQQRPWAPPVPDPEAAVAIHRIVARERPDVVHGHDWLARSYVRSRARGRPALVMSLHYYTITCAKKSLFLDGLPCSGPGPLKCLRCASGHYGPLRGPGIVLGNFAFAALERQTVDLFLPVSETTARGNGLVGSGLPWEVVPNFLRESTLSPKSAELVGQLPPEYLLYVGDLRDAKGINVLLDAYAGLESAPPLVLIGKRWPDSPSILPPGACFFENWPNDAVREAQRRCLALVVPSVWEEPFGIVALEGLASGRPVVASRTGGLAEIVEDGAGGMLVPPGDAASLHGALTRLLNDVVLQRHLADGARRSAARFDPERTVRRFEAAYDRALASSRRRRRPGGPSPATRAG